mmetsp:Transcript_34147/g.42225  ORF Transcript_34147/g.42225 Transcript_34147/m.42225 type:complete len:200 (-) Transcript_34147:537-1136(-)
MDLRGPFNDKETWLSIGVHFVLVGTVYFWTRKKRLNLPNKDFNRQWSLFGKLFQTLPYLVCLVLGHLGVKLLHLLSPFLRKKIKEIVNPAQVPAQVLELAAEPEPVLELEPEPVDPLIEIESIETASVALIDQGRQNQDEPSMIKGIASLTDMLARFKELCPEDTNGIEGRECRLLRAHKVLSLYRVIHTAETEQNKLA